MRRAGYTLKAGRPPTTLTCDAPATTPCAEIVPSGSLITAEKPVVPRLNIPEAPPPPPGANAFEAPAPPALETPRDAAYAQTAPKRPASAVDLPDVHVHQRRGLLRDRGRHGVM